MTYEVNEEPYNDTSPKWSRVTPSEDGVYWMRNAAGRVAVAEMRGDEWVVIGSGFVTSGSENMRECGCEWWSERIREPQ